MKKYNVFGVGNALVDTLVNTNPAFLKENNIRKGVMTLVDANVQSSVLDHLKSHNKQLRSGGSAANTMIALANSGGNGYYAGKVANDDFGIFYKKDMEASGIEFDTAPGTNGSTGTCLVLTTPDADRTMLTHLGISTHLTKSDINVDKLKLSEIAYIEGYLWDGNDTKEASLFTMEQAKKNGVKVAFTYSDPFCVNRSREDFIKLTKEYVDIIFCNHEEAMAISQMDNPEDAIMYISSLCDTVCMTWGSEGAMVAMSGVMNPVPGFPVKAIDTNGAGDAFAGGVLYGLTHGYSVQKACKWGNYVASRIVTEIGARLSIVLAGKQEQILG